MAASNGNEAVKNGRAVTRYDQGYCQRYVRDPCWRVPSLYGSAIEAWNGAKYKHKGDRQPPRGAPCYYSGGQYGHAVIATDPGRIRSTDCTSATLVNDAALSWPETAWGYKYLGWTEDLNGVRLNLSTGGGDDDMPLSEDDLSAIANRINKVLGDFNSHGDPRNPPNEEYANQRLTQIENVVRDIQERVKRMES